MNIIKRLIRHHQQKKEQLRREARAEAGLYTKTLSDLSYVEAHGDRTLQTMLLLKHIHH